MKRNFYNVTQCSFFFQRHALCSTWGVPTIDLMHMTSQKGAPACWGSNEALSRAPSPSMQPAGQPLHAIPAAGPARACGPTESQRSSSTARARSATSLDPQHGVVVMETWRQCIRSINNQPSQGAYLNVLITI